MYTQLLCLTIFTTLKNEKKNLFNVYFWYHSYMYIVQCIMYVKVVSLYVKYFFICEFKVYKKVVYIFLYIVFYRNNILIMIGSKK